MSQGPFYGGGGGGFMKNTPGGYGSTPSGGDAGDRGKNRFLRPVNIAQLLEAKQSSDSDNEWLIDGHPAPMVSCFLPFAVRAAESDLRHNHQVSVVAHVHEVTAQTTSDVYRVSDGTGQMEIRHWIESRSPDDMEADMEVSPLKGSYVRFIGMIRTFSDRKHLNATLMRKVEDFNEVIFHFNEVIAMTMLNLRGPPASSGNANAADEYASLDPVERAICHFMRDNPPPDGGYHVKQIMKAVRLDVANESKNTGITDSDLFANAMNGLTESGVIFSTTDDAHFSLV
ncbi:replication factor A protein 2 [Serendipita sp. 399]|nr:replication factor A protein 2 [Serendipita sp. 399]